MAHNLETENGEVAFALRGAPAWHNLANRIFTKDEVVTTATMLEQAKLWRFPDPSPTYLQWRTNKHKMVMYPLLFLSSL